MMAKVAYRANGKSLIEQEKAETTGGNVFVGAMQANLEARVSN